MRSACSSVNLSLVGAERTPSRKVDDAVALERSLYAKYGGVHFIQTAPTQDINEFVRALPEDKRDNLFEVLKELDTSGMISIQNDGRVLNPYGEEHPVHPNEPNDAR